MKTNLKLALLQMDCQWEDRTANLKHADSLLNLVDADLVVLPRCLQRVLACNRNVWLSRCPAPR